MLDLCRGKGIGKYLMLATESYCKTLGRINLSLDTCCGPALIRMRILIQLLGQYVSGSSYGSGCRHLRSKNCKILHMKKMYLFVLINKTI